MEGLASICRCQCIGGDGVLRLLSIDNDIFGAQFLEIKLCWSLGWDLLVDGAGSHENWALSTVVTCRILHGNNLSQVLWLLFRVYPKRHLEINLRFLPFWAGWLTEVNFYGLKVGNRLTEVFERLHEISHGYLLNVVLLGIKFPLLEVHRVDHQTPVMLLVPSDVLCREPWVARKLLQDVWVVVVNCDVDFQLAEFAELEGLLNEYLLALALHFLKASALAMVAAISSRHLLLCYQINNYKLHKQTSLYPQIKL